MTNSSLIKTTNLITGLPSLNDSLSTIPNSATSSLPHPNDPSNSSIETTLCSQTCSAFTPMDSSNLSNPLVVSKELSLPSSDPSLLSSGISTPTLTSMALPLDLSSPSPSPTTTTKTNTTTLLPLSIATPIDPPVLLDPGALSPLSDVPSEFTESPPVSSPVPSSSLAFVPLEPPVSPSPSPSPSPSLSVSSSTTLPPPSSSVSTHLKPVKRKPRSTFSSKKKVRRTLTSSSFTKKQSSSFVSKPSLPSKLILVEDHETSTITTTSSTLQETFLSKHTLQRILQHTSIPSKPKRTKPWNDTPLDLVTTISSTLDPTFPFHSIPFHGLPSVPFSSSFPFNDPFTVAMKGPLLRTDFISPHSGRTLPAFIYRDFETTCPYRQLLQSIVSHPLRVSSSTSMSSSSFSSSFSSPFSIDYVYFQPSHLIQVNALLTRLFWEGIDVSESLMYPEFGIVAMVGKLVIGCALSTPEGYLSYLAVMPPYESCGIASFMIYWICQLIARDITLHVSANNPAMILYQKFGFKPEEYIVGFYDKYYPTDSKECKNAFLLRLRR